MKRRPRTRCAVALATRSGQRKFITGDGDRARDRCPVDRHRCSQPSRSRADQIARNGARRLDVRITDDHVDRPSARLPPSTTGMPARSSMRTVSSVWITPVRIDAIDAPREKGAHEHLFLRSGNPAGPEQQVVSRRPPARRSSPAMISATSELVSTWYHRGDRVPNGYPMRVRARGDLACSRSPSGDALHPFARRRRDLFPGRAARARHWRRMVDTPAATATSSRRGRPARDQRRVPEPIRATAQA